MKQKRIAMISVHECPLASHEGKERGGINVYTFELSKALSRIGWTIDIFTRIQDDINPRIVQINKNLRVIHLPNGPHIPLSKKEILHHLPEFTQAFSQYAQSYDLIHAHYYLSGLVAHQSNVPYVMSFHTIGLMKELVLHDAKSKDPEERISFERTLAHDARAIIASSEADATYIEKLYDVQAQKIKAIPPGVDTMLFRHIPKAESRKHIDAPDYQRIVLAVGRIDPVKGFENLLVALKILQRKDIALWIVGGDVGQNEKQWSNELRRLNSLRTSLDLVTQVTFVPPQPQETLPYYYNAADVLVMPSHYESFGMVALEAAACGTPVIATDVTGISPILKEFSLGHVISANNPILLSEQIETVLTNPPASTTNITQTWDNTATHVASIYNALFAAGS